MKISQLVKLLLRFLSSRDVKVTWEGQEVELRPENIYKAKNGTVIIDADNNYYKDKFQGKRK